ncbi:acyltransferase [Cohnella lubricantis]|uniref:Acyltransferase n=1 Tax=Cohnella lubricantis TaxID=2163172 RepID=A0A841TIT7_9BACL|nr:acyltransferase [Cohnella lubricantis]MBB6679158.1 acyltransferase [Cohnella lubricantis]MBP2119339.1 peptidoglycan/LPS O-acetylase OafA/YrhL [Cohnella lubricantis]
MTTTARRERLPELDLYRAFAILGVIHVHASSFAAAGQASASPYYYLVNLMNIFFKYGTPCFIFLSSFVLFYNYFGTPVNRSLLSRFYKKRLLYIIAPYVAASLCYYTLVQAFYVTDHPPLASILQTFGLKLATGTAYTHLYFVFINLQFYVLFPLVLWLFQRFRRLVAWAVPIGLAIEWGFVLWNKYVLVLPNKGSYAPTYMSYYLLGLFLAVHFDKLRPWLTTGFRRQSAALRTATLAVWGSWLAAALIHVQLYHNGRAYGIWVNSTWYEALWNLHTLLSVFVLLQAAFWIYRGASSSVVGFLSRLGGLSFAIYLLHPVFLLAYRRFRYTIAPDSLTYLIWMYAGVPVCLFLAWAVAASTFRWVPGAEYLLGNRPAGRAKPQAGRPAGQRAGETIGS